MSSDYNEIRRKYEFEVEDRKILEKQIEDSNNQIEKVNKDLFQSRTENRDLISKIQQFEREVNFSAWKWKFCFDKFFKDSFKAKNSSLN